MVSFNLLLISVIFNMLYSTYNLKSWICLQFNIRIITLDNQCCFRLSPILNILQLLFTHSDNIFCMNKIFSIKSQLQRYNLALKKLFLFNIGKTNTGVLLLKNPHLWFHHFDLKYFPGSSNGCVHKSISRIYAIKNSYVSSQGNF